MRKRLIILLCSLAITPILAKPPAKVSIIKIDKADIETTIGQNEISGLVRSRTYDNIWWVHNDSGNRPMIFPIDSNGDVVQDKWGSKHKDKDRKNHGGIPVELSTNIDWEDIAIDNGLIYIADTGNNNNSRRDLGIYVIAEPNPVYTERVRTLKYIPIRFPDQQTFPAKQWHFDSESLFITNGHLYLMTKHRNKGVHKKGTNLYRLSLSAADPNRINILEKIDSRADMFAPTGADISPNGNRLAVLTLKKLWVFTKPSDGSKWLTANPNTTLSVSLPDNIGQAEAICWDTNTTMRIINEKDRDFFRVKISTSH